MAVSYTSVHVYGTIFYWGIWGFCGTFEVKGSNSSWLTWVCRGVSSTSNVSWTELCTASFHFLGSERIPSMKLLEHRRRLASVEFCIVGFKWSKPSPMPPNLWARPRPGYFSRPWLSWLEKFTSSLLSSIDSKMARSRGLVAPIFAKDEVYPWAGTPVSAYLVGGISLS